MHEKFGFGPVNAQWEAYAQGDKGATMVLKVADGTDFDVLADNLRSDGYTKPKDDDGVWKGGVDLVAELDPTLTPEVQYVALLEDQGLVVTSDNAGYAATRRQGGLGRRRLGGLEDGVDDMADAARRPGQRDAVDRRLRLRRPRDVAGRPGRPGTRPSSWSARPAG